MRVLTSIGFAGGDVETRLLALTFYPYLALVAHRVENFGEYPFEIINATGNNIGVGDEIGIGYVKRRSKLMNRRVDGIAVSAAQA